MKTQPGVYMGDYEVFAYFITLKIESKNRV
jgi:hypothetical protein